VEAEQLALDSAPLDAEGAFQRALSLQQSGQNSEAERVYRDLLKLVPHWVAVHFNLGVLLLARGAWREGFQHLEWRLQKPTSRYKNSSRPRWQGQKLSGQRILLQAEYGYGDMIQFWRFLPQLCELAGEVVLELPTALLPLAAQLDLPLSLHPEGEPLPACDYHLPLLSLPQRLGISQTAEIAVLPPWKKSLTQPVLPSSGKATQVGLVWQGRQAADETQQKAHYRELQRCKALPVDVVHTWVAAFPSVTFYAFQPGVSQRDLPSGLIDLGPQLGDFAQTAELLLQMDRVISVDSAVAHLASSLGLPTWLLLPEPAPWIWPRRGFETPWYPSLRIFRQALPADWDVPKAEIASLLAQTTGTKGPQPA